MSRDPGAKLFRKVLQPFPICCFGSSGFAWVVMRSSWSAGRAAPAEGERDEPHRKLDNAGFESTACRVDGSISAHSFP